MNEFTPQEDRLYEEKYDIEMQIIRKLEVLIAASWDSNTLKQQIESLYKQLDTIYSEFSKLECRENNNKN